MCDQHANLVNSSGCLSAARTRADLHPNTAMHIALSLSCSLLQRGGAAALVSAAKGAGGAWAQPGHTMTPSAAKLPVSKHTYASHAR